MGEGETNELNSKHSMRHDSTTMNTTIISIVIEKQVMTVLI